MLRLGLSLVVAFTVSASAVAVAAVGGPPTIEFDRCDQSLEPCGDPIVVGKARFFDGRYEWVAMSWREGICFYTERINRAGGSGHGGCGPRISPPRDEALYVGWSGPQHGPGARGPRATHVGGPVRPDAAQVRVSYRKRGELRRREAALIHVEGELLEQVGHDEPFAYWGRSLGGCVPSSRIRARAFDAAGSFLGAARGSRAPGCRARRGSP